MPACRVKRKLNLTNVVEELTDLSFMRSVPVFIRLDNEPQFAAKVVRV